MEYLPGFKKLLEKVLQRTDEIFYQQYKKMSVVKDSMRHIHGFKLYLKVSLKFSSSEPISGQSSHLYPLKTPGNSGLLAFSEYMKREHWLEME